MAPGRWKRLQSKKFQVPIKCKMILVPYESPSEMFQVPIKYKMILVPYESPSECSKLAKFNILMAEFKFQENEKNLMLGCKLHPTRPRSCVRWTAPPF